MCPFAARMENETLERRWRSTELVEKQQRAALFTFNLIELAGHVHRAMPFCEGSLIQLRLHFSFFPHTDHSIQTVVFIFFISFV